jgi:hypothetical protein
MNGTGESAPVTQPVHPHVLELSASHGSQIVRLKVGGVQYATSVATLRACEGSFFDVLLSGRWSSSSVDGDNGLFVDRDGEVGHRESRRIHRRDGIPGGAARSRTRRVLPYITP